MLNAVKEEGSGALSKMHHFRTHTLLEHHKFLPEVDRNKLLLEISVLNHFLLDRF